MNHWYSLQTYLSGKWHEDLPRYHNMMEIVFVLGGRGNFNIDGNVYEVEAGTLILIPEGVLHFHEKPVDSSDYCRHLLHYSNEILEKLSTAQTDFVSALEHVSACIRLEKHEQEKLEQILKACEKKGELEQDFVIAQLSFIKLLLSVCEILKLNRQVNPIRDDKHKRIAPILSYIEENLGSDISAKSIAKQFFFSQYYASQLFKQYLGMPVTAYIKYRRVQRARVLLRGNLTIQQVCAQVGFSNVSYFISSFKQIVGMTPGAYKKIYRNVSPKAIKRTEQK